MKKIIMRAVSLALLLACILSVTPALAYEDCAWYVVDSSQPRGYCYLYSRPSDRDGVSQNLGRYDNGDEVFVIDYYGGRDGKYNYCFVSTVDGKFGYMHDYALTLRSNYIYDYWSYDGPEYYVYSTDPYGYCYLYSEASDINGQNLGRYDNYDVVKMICYYGGQHGRFNYCYVITPDNQRGFIHDYSLYPVDCYPYGY